MICNCDFNAAERAKSRALKGGEQTIMLTKEGRCQPLVKAALCFLACSTAPTHLQAPLTCPYNIRVTWPRHRGEGRGGGEGMCPP